MRVRRVHPTVKRTRKRRKSPSSTRRESRSRARRESQSWARRGRLRHAASRRARYTRISVIDVYSYFTFEPQTRVALFMYVVLYYCTHDSILVRPSATRSNYVARYANSQREAPPLILLRAVDSLHAFGRWGVWRVPVDTRHGTRSLVASHHYCCSVALIFSQLYLFSP